MEKLSKLECMVDVLITLMKDKDFDEALMIARSRLDSDNTGPSAPENKE